MDATSKSAVTTSGRNDSIKETVITQRSRLFDFIRRRIRSEADAEDIVQDVFFQLTESYSVTEPIERISAWLFTVARHKIIDWYRERRKKGRLLNEKDPSVTLNLEEFLFNAGESPDEVLERSMIWSALEDALDELPEKQREVFVMHELEGRSFKEIAELTGEPINTLLSRKRYAVLYLREELKELFEEL